MLRVAPRISASGIGKDGKKWRGIQSFCELLGRDKRPPVVEIRGGECGFPGAILLTVTTKMFEEIFECEEWKSGAGLSPIQKDAPIVIHHDVAGIEIEVADGAWNVGVGSFGESVLQLCPEV
jgi:hypothetical protein